MPNRFFLASSAALTALLLSGCHRTSTSSHGETLIPVGERRVVADNAAVMKPADAQDVQAHADDLARRTGHPFALVTVESLQGKPQDKVASSILKAWAMSRPGASDAVVILLARKEKALAFGVEPGMALTLNDDRINDVRRAMIPHLMSGDLSKALDEGSVATMAVMATAKTPRARGS